VVSNWRGSHLRQKASRDGVGASEAARLRFLRPASGADHDVQHGSGRVQLDRVSLLLSGASRHEGDGLRLILGDCDEVPMASVNRIGVDEPLVAYECGCVP
jgi:hypothetical protein